MKIRHPRSSRLIPPQQPHSGTGSRHGEEAAFRVSAIIIAAALAVIVVGVVRYSRAPEEAPASTTTPAEPADGSGLSTVTLNALRNLGSPVEIRFYALPENTRGAGEMAGFIERVDTLLSEFRQHGRGLVRITRHDSGSDSSVRSSALADGLEPLSRDSRNPGFLGLAMICDDRKVAIPRLAPEWEQALEFDLTRAILQVTESKGTSAKPVETTTLDPSTIEQVRHAIPDLESVPFDEGYQILHSAAMQQFREVVTAMDAQIKEARERVKSAHESGSEARLKTALEDLQRIQSDQTRKLQEIADDLQKQTKALQQLQGGTR